MSGGSTFPVWAFILIAGAVIAGILGSCNPYITANDKKRMQFYATSRQEMPEINIKYHYNENLFIFGAIVVSYGALIAFFISGFSSIAIHYGNGFFTKVIIVVIAIMAAVFSQFLMAGIAMAGEFRQIESIRERALRRYGVTIEDCCSGY